MADDLLARIVGGEIETGAILPREDELAAHYEVNRGVVREAIKLLEVHRLVRPVRRRGTVVLDPMASLSPEVLRAMVSPRSGQVSTAMLASLLEIRAHLDIQMTRLAAERATDDDIAAFERCYDAMTECVDDPLRYHALTDETALCVARATHNPIFEMMVHWNQTVVADLADMFRAGRPANDKHLEGLRVVIDLFRLHRADDAEALVRAYHEWARPRILAAAALATGQPLPENLP